MTRTSRAVWLGCLLVPGVADAHGLWGHVHVTGWAVENMPDDELRVFLLDDPEVFNALLFGAVFTDTGYSKDTPASRAYSEHTHWEPFVTDYIAWIRANDPPPWTTLESKKRVAFLLGCASHGMQDEIFDTLFLAQVEERDGAGQEHTDPGTDGFLSLDGHLRFFPVQDIPMSTVLELYQGLPEEVTEDVIQDAVDLVTSVYINEEFGPGFAAGLGNQYADDMPWGRVHYLDPEVPGSLRAEIYPTMRYQQAVWARLHGEFAPDDVPVFAFPEAPRRLRSGDPATVDSWVTLIFGAGVRYQDDLLELRDPEGQLVPFTQGNTRWNAAETRVIKVAPTEPLTPGGWYTARLRADVELIDGGVTSEVWELPFQVACATEDDPACPPLGDVPIASIDGVPADPPGDTPKQADTGCGCGTPTPSRWGSALLLALAGVFRRRAAAAAPR